MTRSNPRLLTPRQLAELLEPPAAPRPLLVHVSDAAGYLEAHLPGALLVEPRELVDGGAPAPGRLPSLARLEALFARLGYSADRHVVAYDDEGGGWAGRFLWTLDVIGHDRWSYLDGGIHAWHDEGLPLVSGAAQAPAGTTVHLEIDTGPIAELEDVLSAIGDPGQIIWDVRSGAEFLGLRSGSRRAGHVPGARHLDWLALKDAARQQRLREDLPALLARNGIDADKRVITHCQSHHRSGLSYLVGRLLGMDIRAYHGSWGEWGNRDDTPVETGGHAGEPAS